MTSARPASTRGTAGLRSKRLQLIRLGTGLKQSQLLVRLEQAARELDVEIAPRSSLKTMVSKWENGAPMSADYRRLFRRVYGASDEQLGFTTSDPAAPQPVERAPEDIEAWQLADAMTRCSITLPTLTAMERAVFGYASRYPASPPAELLPQVREQMRRLKQAIDGPQPLDVRRRCITLLGVLAGLAGNLSLDIGRPDQAEAMFDVGRLAGAESADADLTAWVSATASIGPFYAGQPEQAATMLDQAAAVAARGTGARRRAWIAALRARALAAAGQAQARPALDEAYALMASVSQPPSGTDFFDPARLDGIAGSCYLLLRDAGHADELLSGALARRAPSDAKGRALLTLDLAACRVIDGDPEEAGRLVGTALDLAHGALVRPITDRAARLRADMAGWHGSRAVADLDARLAMVAGYG